MTQTTTPQAGAADAAAARAAAAPDRRAPLRLSGLAEGGPDPVLERATRLAARVLGVPVSLLSIVAEDRQVFAARTGLAEPVETPLSHSFCKHVVARDAPLRVTDARADPLVAQNGAVVALGMMAYLGVPVRAPDGTPLGSLCAVHHAPRDWSDDDLTNLTDIAAGVEGEVAARIRAAEAAAAEERLRAVLDALPIGVGVVGASALDPLLINGAGREVLDPPSGAPGLGHGGMGARRPDGTPLAPEDDPVLRAARAGEDVRAEPVVLRRPGAADIELEVDAVRVEDAAHGALAVAAFRDVSARNAARRAARASEARLAEVLQSTTDAVVRLDERWCFTYLNDNAEGLFGTGHLGRSIWDVFPVAIGGPYWESLHEAREGGRPQEVTARLAPIERWIEARSFPAGREMTVFFRDVTEARTAEEDRKLLVHELNHRVKNVFAVVSGMVGLAARTATGPREMARDLRGRIGALAAAHELIRPAVTMEEMRGGADLGALARAVLRPHVAPGGARVTADGPPVVLGPGATTSLALALHELATNAAKHGALRGAGGRVAVAWRLAGERLALDWRERADAPAAAPRDGGFGGTLLDLSVRGQLGGDLTVEPGPGGLMVRMDLGLDRLRA